MIFLRKLENHGLLSTMFYKKSQFKFDFLYFNKNSLLYPKKDNERKNAQNRKMLWNISKKKVFLTIFRSTSDGAISYSYFFVLFYLMNYKIIMRSIHKLNFKTTGAVNKILETGDFNSSLPGLPWYSKSRLCIELEIYF